MGVIKEGRDIEKEEFIIPHVCLFLKQFGS